MPYSVNLPRRFAKAGWKAKIREKERLEPPHVAIMRRTEEWRLGLRNAEFLVPPGGSWNEIPREVRETIMGCRDELIEAWNERYPSNPVMGGRDDAE